MSAHEIIPRLWLGNAKAAGDDGFLQANRINVIMNCTKDIPFSPRHRAAKYRVHVDDNLQEGEIHNMKLWGPEIAFTLLKHYYAGDRILVHCYAGMQRSAACVAMFLIAHFGWRFSQAHDHIRERRPVAFRPGVNFLAAILEFEQYYHREVLAKGHEAVLGQKRLIAGSSGGVGGGGGVGGIGYSYIS